MGNEGSGSKRGRAVAAAEPKQVKTLAQATVATDVPHAEPPPEHPIAAALPVVLDPTPEVGKVPDEPPPPIVQVARHNEFERVAARDAQRAVGDDGMSESTGVRHYRVTRKSTLYLPGQMTELAEGSIVSTLTHDLSERGPIRSQGIPIEECGAPSIGPAPLTGRGHVLLTAPVTPRSFDPVVGPAAVPGAAVVGPGFETKQDADEARDAALAGSGGGT